MTEICETGCKKAVLTGVHFDNKQLGAASYDKETGKFGIYLAPRIEGFYHGTGDVFASALLAGLMNGKTTAEATEIAVDFTENSIIRTKNSGRDTRYGVNFEQGIPELVKKLGLI